MKLRSLEERELISAIRSDFSESRKGLALGIGDDAAVILAGKKQLILTKDLLFEDVHFLPSLHPPFLLGRKSLSVNMSDIAAMGGTPMYALLGLGLPPAIGTEWIADFFAGFRSAAKESKVSLVGGDISESKIISVSVTVVGEGTNIIPRSGARPGHLIFISGSLGNAKAGLLLLKKGFKLGDDQTADTLLRAFLDPIARIPLGKTLSWLKIASAMIDISDGLSVDLFHLCQESGVGAEIILRKLPLAAEIRAFFKRPFEMALHGGEDYELLFTVAPQDLRKVLVLKKKFRLSCVGRIERGQEIFVIDRRGRKSPLKTQGYQHFQVRP